MLENVTEKHYSCFLSYFKGREDYFGNQFYDKYFPVKAKLDNYHLQKHFAYLATFGVYVLTSDNTCNFICIDVDIPKNNLNEINFSNRAQKFNYLKNTIFKILGILTNNLNIENNSILVEDTGGRGYHIWLFFSSPIKGEVAIKLYKIIQHFIDVEFEFFPKQENVKKLGNLIKLPLGIHQKYGKKSSFIKFNDVNIEYIESIEDNLDYLKEIKKVNPELINTIIQKYNQILPAKSPKKVTTINLTHSERTIYKRDLGFLFAKCSALKNIVDKAEQGIALSYNEAFHFSNIVLSVDDSKEYLIETIKKSYGSKFNQEKTEQELENIVNLCPASCETLFSQGFCKKKCHDQIKNPLLYYLVPTIKRKLFRKDQIIDAIADKSNIIDAYIKLKKYHKEDNIFYDEFDCEYFEKKLDINSKFISTVIKKHEDIPFIGYLAVRSPKKVDDDLQMQYRQFAYPNIYDQVVIQSFFNIIARLFEESFSENSYGYRVNIDNPQSGDIFCDWREYHPKFKSKVLNHIRQANIKYYISCDIKGYYDNIRQDILLEQIRAYIKDDYIYRIIEKIIKLYKFEENSDKGLPQGPAYARILANLYLDDFDKKMQLSSAGYYRYVDDIILLYETKEDAEAGLKEVHTQLHRLGLILSDDEKKKPDIIKADKEDRLISKLDELQYGIFEEYKFIKYLDEKRITNFFEIIEKNKFSPQNSKEVLEINDKLPSILCFIEINQFASPQIKKRAFSIINYLVEQKTFYPKRLNNIFDRIIPIIDESKCTIPVFYSRLDEVHKIYFLLSLYKAFKKDNNYEDSLKVIIEENLTLDNKNFFTKGFAVIINYKLKNNKYSYSKDLVCQILNCDNYFSRLKLYNVINYYTSTPEIKELLRNHISNTNLFLEKKYLFSNLDYLNSDYLDSQFFSNLLKYNSFFFIIECCEIFSLIRDYNELFVTLEELFSRELDYKGIIIAYIQEVILEKYKNSGKAELNNLKELYKRIRDEELRKVLLTIINNIQKSSGYLEDNFSKNHQYVSDYNQCFYFKSINSNDNGYNFLELIPISKLKDYEYIDLNAFFSQVNDLSHNKILPELKCEYDSTSEEIIIKYTINESGYEEVKNIDLSSINTQNILDLFEILNNLYKKADQFLQIFGRIPLISKENILINYQTKEILFRNIGSSLCPIYCISKKSINVEGEGKEIPLMISLLLKDLLFNNDAKKEKDFFDKHKTGIEHFLEYFIVKMSISDYSLILSANRFNYIIKSLKDLRDKSIWSINILYLKERLKALIYKQNCENINWINICDSLKDFYSELLKIYNGLDINNIKFKNKIYLDFTLPRNLHYLSKLLLNISLNLNNIIINIDARQNLIDLLELLNFYGVFCIESISFFKTIKPGNLEYNLLIYEELTVNADCYSQKYDKFDLETIQNLINKSRESNIFEYFESFTLKQISFVYLLNNFDSEFNSNNVTIKNSSKLNNKDFNSLAYNLLVRLPDIEEENNEQTALIIENLNKNIVVVSDKEKIKTDILLFCKDINKIRKKIGYRRNSSKITNNDRFPEILLGFRGNKTSFKLGNKIPLSSKFPYLNYKCSYDELKPEIYNVVIPCKEVVEFISLIKQGIYREILFIYSGKALVFFDLTISIILFILTFLILYPHQDIENKKIIDYVYIGLHYVAWIPCAFFIGKSLFDLKYWFINFQSLLSLINYKSEQTVKNLKNDNNEVLAD